MLKDVGGGLVIVVRDVDCINGCLNVRRNDVSIGNCIFGKGLRILIWFCIVLCSILVWICF